MKPKHHWLHSNSRLDGLLYLIPDGIKDSILSIALLLYRFSLADSELLVILHKKILTFTGTDKSQMVFHLRPFPYATSFCNLLFIFVETVSCCTTRYTEIEETVKAPRNAFVCLWGNRFPMSSHACFPCTHNFNVTWNSYFLLGTIEQDLTRKDSLFSTFHCFFPPSLLLRQGNF